MLQLLLAHGAEPNARTSSGNTALGVACRRGSSSCVRLLLEAGADVAMNSTVSDKDTVDSTPLQIATKAGHSQVGPSLRLPVAVSWIICV